ncbi:MAG: hypothetical protein HY574_12820 [candidate division NC10 bacterium]|nr:hypothetical protein [candidate division NC10 bacterium]
MTRLIFSVSCLGALLGAPMASAASSTVTVWVPAELPVDTATTRIATILQDPRAGEVLQGLREGRGEVPEDR